MRSGNIQRFGHNIPFGLEVSLGLVSNYRTVNKFGETVNADSGDPTDVYDDSVLTAIWVPPTQARIHQLASGSADDASDGTGLRSIEVSGFKTWDDLTETKEILFLNGLTNVPTVSAYVVIFRIRGLTWGSGGLNAGKITATASVDGTITAAITALQNQTQMAIFACTSNQQLRMTTAFCEIVDGIGVTARANGELLQMIDPEANIADNTAWTNKENFSAIEGVNPWVHDYGENPKKFDGPCIVKIQVTSNVNDTHVIAGFDGYIYEKDRGQ